MKSNWVFRILPVLFVPVFSVPVFSVPVFSVAAQRRLEVMDYGGQVQVVDLRDQKPVFLKKKVFIENSVQIKVPENQKIILRQGTDSYLTILAHSDLKIFFDKENQNKMSLEITRGSLLLVLRSGESIFVSGPIFSFEVKNTEVLLNYQNGLLEAQVLDGELDFRGLGRDDSVVLKKLEIASFQADLENAGPIVDVFLKGRKVARGLLSPMRPLEPAQKEKILKEIASLNLARKKSVEKATKVIDPSLICKSPFAKFNQCSWTCLNNPKDATRCEYQKKNVRCLRQRCFADGRWSDPTELAPSSCLIPLKVGACGY